MDMMMICIRCGSKEHSTRDHDEGKTGDAPIKSATGEAYGGAKAAPKKSTPHPKSAASPTGKNASLYGSPSRVQPDKCWKSVGRNPGIPDIIAPKIVERSVTGECIGYLEAVGGSLGGLKISCPCKACQKKAEKAVIDTLRRQGKID